MTTSACLLVLALCAPPADTREAWLASRSGLPVTTIRAMGPKTRPAEYLAAVKVKPVYSALWFSPPDAEPGEARWPEWQPKLSVEWGLSYCKWLFHSDIFPRNEEGGGYDNSGWIDEDKLSKLLYKIPKGTLVVLNVENHPVLWEYWNILQPGGVHANQEAVRNRIRLVEWARRHNPFCRYGYYDVIPIKYEGLVMHARETWKQQLKDTKPLADAVDFLLPEVYLDTDWSEEFACLYVARTVVGCRDYFPDKPVYPLLWMEYHDLHKTSVYDYSIETHRSRLIPAKHWRSVLEHSYMLGDGVMFWGGYKIPWLGDPWWGETKDFLMRRGVAPLKEH